MKSRTLDLNMWIDQKTPQGVARLLGTHAETVRYWRRGKGIPHAKQMFQIKKLTKGKITPTAIIDSYYGAKSR